ncbi:MAG TPA: phosphoribulokinase [Coxiellaceae bacterium]|nr:phosphoribulokinase [Coxiellaceae bacterium]
MLSSDERHIIEQGFQSLQIHSTLCEQANTIYSTLLQHALRWSKHKKPIIIGIAGSNGSGKSTLAYLLALLLEHHGINSINLSIDDFYLTQSERNHLANTIHPLLKTRSAGTIDATLLFNTLSSLKQASTPSTLVPQFSKVIDDQLPKNQWQTVRLPVDVILFEGFCLKAQPQTENELLEPLNTLETEQDPELIWRNHINQSLHDLQTSFDLIDHLIFLSVDHFDNVINNRYQTEVTLKKQSSHYQPLSKQTVADFLMHHERVFYNQHKHLPEIADLTIPVSDLHQ